MRKIKIVLGIVIFGGAILFNTFGLKQNESSQKLNLKSFLTEALAGTEGCTTTPGENDGRCYKNVNGIEWNCVSFTWPWNCSGD